MDCLLLRSNHGRFESCPTRISLICKSETLFEWDKLSWDLQQTYLDGLAEDESVPFSYKGSESETGDLTPGLAGPQIRENVDMGQKVLDLTAFRAELEAGRARRAEGGEPGV